MKRWAMAGLVVLMGAALLCAPELAAGAVAKGLAVCMKSILPTLFPFFVLTELLVRAGLTAELGAMFAPLMRRLFHLPGSAAAAFVTGALGGYPVGAKTVAALYASGELDRNSAEQAVTFCCNAGPAFLVGVVGAGVFQSPAVGAALYVLHLTASVVTGLLLRPKGEGQELPSAPVGGGASFPAAFTQSVQAAGTTAILVCSYVLIFQIISDFLSVFLPENAISALLHGLLELAGGTAKLAEAAMDGRLKLCAAAMLTGFGGICVLAQTAAVLSEAGLSVKPYVKGKLLQALFSGVLALAVGPLMPLELSCMTVQVDAAPVIRLLMLCLLCVWIGALVKISYGNLRRHRL